METDKKELARLILGYLEKHPQAEDTLRGISNWWLASQQIEESIDKVAEVIEDLVERGLIETRKNRNGSTLYKVQE